MRNNKADRWMMTITIKYFTTEEQKFEFSQC